MSKTFDIIFCSVAYNIPSDEVVDYRSCHNSRPANLSDEMVDYCSCHDSSLANLSDEVVDYRSCHYSRPANLSDEMVDYRSCHDSSLANLSDEVVDYRSCHYSRPANLSDKVVDYRSCHYTSPGELLRRKLHDTIHMQTRAILWDPGMCNVGVHINQVVNSFFLAINSLSNIVINVHQVFFPFSNLFFTEMMILHMHLFIINCLRCSR
jgi:hypothetical protein